MVNLGVKQVFDDDEDDDDDDDDDDDEDDGKFLSFSFWNHSLNFFFADFQTPRLSRLHSWRQLLLAYVPQLPLGEYKGVMSICQG